MAAEAITTAIIDEYMPIIKPYFDIKYTKELFSAINVLISFVCGLPMITNVTISRLNTRFLFLRHLLVIFCVIFCVYFGETVITSRAACTFFKYSTIMPHRGRCFSLDSPNALPSLMCTVSRIIAETWKRCGSFGWVLSSSLCGYLQLQFSQWYDFL